MTNDLISNRDAETKNRAFWNEVAPVHLKACKEVAILREEAEALDEIELREVGDVNGEAI